jgi:hypothetical protein
MSKVAPFHSSEKTEVYHNNSECTEGNNIEKRNLVSGTGGKRLCEACARLNGAKKS